MNQQTYVVIGGGAAGFFGAIICAQNHPQAKVILLEKNRQFLAKVRISGGGQCNVTHSCPSILKLSAWGARLLHDRDYRFFLLAALEMK